MPEPFDDIILQKSERMAEIEEPYIVVEIEEVTAVTQQEANSIYLTSVC